MSSNHKESKKMRKKQRNYKKSKNRTAISTYLPITTLNANELNSPNKRLTVAE